MNPITHYPTRRWHRQEGEIGALSGLPAVLTHPGGGRGVGLALSSGGARGLAHIGVLQVFEEHAIKLDALSGTSMGAYVGALAAAGLPARRLSELAAEIRDRRTLLKLLDFQFPPSNGLIRGEKIRAHLERDLGTLTFAELAVPALFVATDLDSMDAHVFDSGPIAAAVHASAAIPGVCVPVRLNGRRFTDGGASEPLPVSLLRRRFQPRVVVAVNVMPESEDFETCRDRTFGRCKPRSQNLFRRLLRRLGRLINLMQDGNVLDTFHRALMAAQLRLIQKECLAADLVIRPRFASSSWHDFENFDQYIQSGREAALAALPALESLLAAPPAPVPGAQPQATALP